MQKPAPTLKIFIFRNTNKIKRMRTLFSILLFISFIMSSFSQSSTLNDKITKIVDEETDKYKKVYLDLHQNPELSFMEFRTSKKMADNLRSIGFEVTEGVGGTGVVGIFRNGKGRVLMLRTDMDALPVKETTGLPYASKVLTKDASGAEVAVMHACGHDLHMSMWLGTLSTLVKLKDEWKGTIMAVAQPAEEGSGGAIAMINDGLFLKFPVPDYAFCYHVNPELPAGTVGYYPGPIFAGVKSVDMTIYGSGGHGAMPHTTIDPIVLSSRIILDLQTIVSREINPVKPAVVTVGSIHGGTKHNIIPDEVKLQLTIRFFEDKVYEQIREAIIRIARGSAASAGLKEDKMPLIKFTEQYNPPVSNDPDLVLNTVKSMQKILGNDRVVQVDPATVAEDFGKYGRTDEKIPIALFWLGGLSKEKWLDNQEKGTPVPPLHNSYFAPDFEPSFKGGVAAMSKSFIDIFGNRKN
jgi:hippurate hydrolase